MTIPIDRGPLDGVTVLDTSNMLMGPFATGLLGSLGARVIKVEPPIGDISRSIADVDGNLAGPIHLNVNRGKESIVLDLRDDDDYAVFADLVAQADVVVHNRPAGTEQKLRLDFASLSAINPRIIVCALCGFGSGGRYASLPAYDDVMQAVSGIASHQTGAGEPEYVRADPTDKITGMLGVAAVNAALFERERSGTGQFIEVPMFETMVHFLLAEQQGAYVYDPPRGKAGYARTNSPHRHPFRTRDGLIGLLPSTDAHWTAVFRILGREEVGRDPRFGSVTARSAHIDALYEWLSGELAAQETEPLLAAFRTSGVPAMHVNSIEDLFEDPHLVETGFFEEVQHPQLGSLRQAAPPFRFSRSGTPRLAAAPILGADGERLRAEFARQERKTITKGAS